MTNREKAFEILLLLLSIIGFAIWKIINYIILKAERWTRCIFRRKENILMGILITFLYVFRLFYIFFIRYDINYGQISEEVKENNKKN